MSLLKIIKTPKWLVRTLKGIIINSFKYSLLNAEVRPGVIVSIQNISECMRARKGSQQGEQPPQSPGTAAPSLWPGETRHSGGLKPASHAPLLDLEQGTWEGWLKRKSEFCLTGPPICVCALCSSSHGRIKSISQRLPSHNYSVEFGGHLWRQLSVTWKNCLCKGTTTRQVFMCYLALWNSLRIRSRRHSFCLYATLENNAPDTFISPLVIFSPVLIFHEAGSWCHVQPAVCLFHLPLAHTCCSSWQLRIPPAQPRLQRCQQTQRSYPPLPSLSLEHLGPPESGWSQGQRAPEGLKARARGSPTGEGDPVACRLFS